MGCMCGESVCMDRCGERGCMDRCGERGCMDRCGGCVCRDGCGGWRLDMSLVEGGLYLSSKNAGLGFMKYGNEITKC